MIQVNVGCGATPTPGWLNFDNSPTLVLAMLPRWFLATLGQRGHFALAAKSTNVRQASAARLPLASCTADTVYSCHMLEHLNPVVARHFLDEAFRVLRPGGVLRVSVPDLESLCKSYLNRGDANAFMQESLLSERASRLSYVLTGPRGHQWMYDGISLVKAVTESGFADVGLVPFGTTRIPSPGALDLFERSEGSICVEGTRPKAGL